jgi:hypothetical protein
MPPRNSWIISGVITSFSVLPFGDPPRQLAADRADLLLQLAHARLARVVPRDQRDALLRELDQLRVDAVLLGLPRDQVLVAIATFSSSV